MTFDGRTAVITGAGSGIGRGIAKVLARRGCNLALADVDQAGHDETAAMVERFAPVSYRKSNGRSMSA